MRRATIGRDASGATQMAELQKLLHGARSPVALLGGSRWSRSRCSASRLCRALRAAGRLHLPPPDAVSRRSRPYAGDLGLGWIRSCSRASRKRISSCSSAGASPRFRARPTRCSTFRRRSRPGACLSRSERARPGLCPHLAINASPIAFTAALEGVHPPGLRCPGARARRRRMRIIWPGAIRARSVHAGALQMGEAMAHLRKMLPSDTIFCNGAGNFATWVHRFWPFRITARSSPPPPAPWATACRRRRRQAHPARQPRGGVRRRRRLPHERAGIRHRRAIRPADPGDPARQRHVRHDPHAPGARISRPRLGDDAEEPGLRRLCQGLRRLRRARERRKSSRRPCSARSPPASRRSCTA